MTQVFQSVETQGLNVSEGAEPMAPPRAAYQRLLPEILAVPEERLVVINLDIPSVVATGLGVLPEVRALESEIRKLHDFDITAFEKLGDYALALHHANVAYLAATTPPEALTHLIERGTAARELLLTDIASFIAHGHIAPRRSGELVRTLGHRGIAVDVGRLTEIVREAWPKLQGKTSLTFEKLIEFETLSLQLLDALGLKEQGEAATLEISARRQRVFTLFVRAYDEVRRAVAYLRWHKGDVDNIVPSLYSAKGARRPSSSSGSSAGSTGSSAGSAGSSGGSAGSSAGSTPSTSGTEVPAPGVSGSAGAAAAPPAAVPVGHPGSDPFGP